MKNTLIIIFLMFAAHSQAQHKPIEIRGSVFDEFLIPYEKAIVKIKNGPQTKSDKEGNFLLSVKELPIEITVMADGFSPETLIVEDSEEEVTLILKESSALDQVVISASRTPERIFESPVSVSRIGSEEIKSIASVNYYDGLASVKDVSTFNIGVLQKIVNTRGFTDSQNFRFVQLVDGVDNVIPQTDMSFGNTFGVNQLDIQSVEVLPGASSALYGSSAFNGVLLMETKSPFDYQGISAELKYGATVQEKGTNSFYNPSLRIAYKFNDKVAAKINYSQYEGEDWHADDCRDISATGQIKDADKRNSSSYNGINVYGDENSQNLKLGALVNYFNEKDNSKRETIKDLISKTPNVFVSRTGYEEGVLTSNDAKSTKIDATINYRPWGNEILDISFTSKHKLGDYVRQVSPGRYRQNDTKYIQHILQFKGPNFFVRGYHTKIDFGNYYGMIPTSVVLNEKNKPQIQWYEEYTNEFINRFNSRKFRNREQAISFADEFARLKADRGRLKPGTKKFKSQLNRITTTSANEGGSKYFGLSSLNQADFQYDFSNKIDMFDFLVGGSYRQNTVDTKGTIYTDKPDDLIKLYQYGIYSQIKKTVLDDRLKTMASLRYDGSKNFKSTFSPRIAVNYLLGEEKSHNIRFSYQTAFRNPTVENQYLGAVVGRNAYVVGSLPENWKRVDLPGHGIKVNEELIRRTGVLGQTFYKFTGDILSSLKDNAGYKDMLGKVGKNVKTLQTFNFVDEKLESEGVKAYEVGYRGLVTISNTLIELESNFYFNKYNDFIAKSILLIPTYGDITKDHKFDVKELEGFDKNNPKQNQTYSAAVLAMIKGDYATFVSPFNSSAEINSYGFSSSLRTKILKNFDLSIAYNFNDFNIDRSTAPYFLSAFNTPKHSFKSSLGNKKIFKNFGFNLSHRWSSEHLWESAYGNGMIEARSVFDAQATISIPSLKSRIKIGGDNILGKSYYTTIGTPSVGSLYYISWVIND